MRKFLYSDPHFGHGNILNFTDYSGQKTREFWASDREIERHDQELLHWYNETVADEDWVYIGGDFMCGKGANVTRLRSIVSQMKGKKYFLLGNHDKLNISAYDQLFHMKPCWIRFDDEDFVFTHVPLHPGCFGKYPVNVHGHTHTNLVKRPDGSIDPRYINVCVERTNYRPIDVEEIAARVAKVKAQGFEATEQF